MALIVCPNCQAHIPSTSKFCPNCGQNMSGGQTQPTSVPVRKCPKCDTVVAAGATFCQNCGTATLVNAVVCVKCGVALATAVPAGAKSKLAAGLLGIFLGGFGVHRFYLGFAGIGVAQILVTMVTCGMGGIWGFIEGILILTGSMNIDAQGQPLGP